ncbi:hypothetical protein LZG04_14540 [Saccharothrix sp. S26]|uniref:hypothetical protein n=1 Tax=Saccharothrix sp. S26 TaxID=2907215 RepID=UPI001F21A6B6|nr:hypothetical protein [Saccharothrix sp. S26]MCE6996013.1 hypothetical protein [Saccharothrix sp. S26]
MINGVTEDMAAFKPRQLDLTAVAREAVPGRCGGGVLGCPPFQAADEASTAALTTYLTAADQELVRLRDIAVACADDYLRGDGTAAQALVRARDAAPTGPAPVFAEATRLYRNVRRGPGGEPAALA